MRAQAHGDNEGQDAAIGAIVPWFGCNRMLASAVGEELKGCRWIGVAFAGGMPELAHVNAPTIVVNDLHRHVINLARVIAEPVLGVLFYKEMRRKAFHPDELKRAQRDCAENEGCLSDGHPHLGLARSYFISQWMGRSGKGGTDGEFRGQLPLRWNANGGDSNKRYRSAVASILAFRRILARCNFSTLDVFDFLGNVKDEQKHALYLDPPFPGVGGEYKHKFTEKQHETLAGELAGFSLTRVVCRFYDHPLIRKLYPEPKWTWRRLKGRDQANNAEKPEVLIVNGPSYAKEAA